MNKNQFLQALDRGLKKLPSSEREEILQDFEEHFTFGLEEGKTEEQIADSLGSPQQIAKEMIATYHVERVESTATTGNIFRAVWAVIGLGFFNLIIVLGPFIAFVGIVFAGWVSAIAFIASPLLVFADVLIHPGAFAFFDVFFSLTLCGLGLFIAIGMFYVTNFLIKGLVRYLAYNVKVVKGGLKHA